MKKTAAFQIIVEKVGKKVAIDPVKVKELKAKRIGSFKSSIKDVKSKITLPDLVEVTDETGYIIGYLPKKEAVHIVANGAGKYYDVNLYGSNFHLIWRGVKKPEVEKIVFTDALAFFKALLKHKNDGLLSADDPMRRMFGFSAEVKGKVYWFGLGLCDLKDGIGCVPKSIREAMKYGNSRNRIPELIANLSERGWKTMEKKFKKIETDSKA